MRNLLAAIGLVAVALTTSTADARTSHRYVRHATYHSFGPSTGRHYRNADGNSVHSPMQAGSRPAGASAHCRDGSWSFSQHHRGTCSHHGGVESW
ncbi:DUF3761 domain-containing protein [Novosphingobium terrae]|uniref:DUF3761 domain-containing protein n=1 Tax=Novosphingobium terrae TaxID=2726189 RepID=UPI00197F862C|nr:DUF3761 domain-containing protein [Novosphingobium terrae]